MKFIKWKLDFRTGFVIFSLCQLPLYSPGEKLCKRMVELSSVLMKALPGPDAENICCHLRQEPLMIWGGPGKSGKKKLNGYSRRKKKVQRLVAEEKKVQRLVAEEKKNSTRILCPGPPPQIINGPSLNGLIDPSVNK